MVPFAFPVDYPRFKLVSSFDELANTPFEDGVNALCWPRVLDGDFSEIAQLLTLNPGINSIQESELLQLKLSAPGQVARQILLEDLKLLRSIELQPELSAVAGCQREEPDGPMFTDVYSFHVDSATDEADTWLCTYHGASSEGLRNEDAIRKADLPEMRVDLLKLYGGSDEEGFVEYLTENFYDLHYASKPGSVPFVFGAGNLWRIAVEYPGRPVPPCIHRAPITLPGETRRLLLIS